MQLNVSMRIGGGYAVILLLASGIFITGLFAISSVNANLTVIEDQTLPSFDTAGDLLSTSLLAHDELLRLADSGSKDDEEKHKAEFQRLLDLSIQTRQHLAELVAGDPTQQTSLAASDQALDDAFAHAQSIIDEHIHDLDLGKRVSKLNREFGDMSDEVSSDLDSLGTADKTKGAAAKFAQEIANISAVVKRNLAATNSAAVSAAQQTLQSDLQTLQSELLAIPTDSDIHHNHQKLNDSLKRWTAALSGDDSLLLSYAKQLTARKAVKTQLQEMDAALLLAVNATNSFVDTVQSTAKQVQEHANSTALRSRWILIGFAVVALTLSILISLTVIRSIQYPLNSTVASIRRIATGDLTEHLHIHAEDELGDLARNVNTLVNNLRTMLHEISNNSLALAAQAEQSAANATRSFAAINEQKQETEMIASAMTEMTATVAEVSSSASKTLQQVEQAHEATIKGQEVVSSNIVHVRQLSVEIERSADVIQKLSEFSESIGSVLDVIRGIAEQTNLLALNAAIEAARAGEQGRGFAVVADEVRTLASRTQSSTQEIQQMIERLQSGAKQAVTVMKASCLETQNSVVSIGRSGENLENITHAVQTIRDMSIHIASAAEEQDSVTRELHRNVTTIANAADANAIAAKENQDSSVALAKLADQLKALIAQFKL